MTTQTPLSIKQERSSTNVANQNVFVVFNPKAGSEDQGEEIRSALASHFTSPHWKYEIYETTGKEDLPAICRAACEKGASLVIAAGGDGTVVGVGNGLVNSRVPLGIIPLGTGNDLARVLSIPLKLDEAFDVLVGDHDIIEVDALKVGERYFFSNVSVGISPTMMKETKSDQKKRFGRLAYLWTLVKRSSIFQLRRYQLTVDGQARSIRACEVLVSNTTLLDAPPHLFGPPETLNDGHLEAYMVTAQTLGDYLHLLRDVISHPGQSAAKLFHLEVKRSVRIESGARSELVQADGEVIGHTPVEIQLVLKAIHVIMAKPKVDQATA